jgi:peptidoglycan hydrolase-like protein with peptidoglycan-binding domain
MVVATLWFVAIGGVTAGGIVAYHRLSTGDVVVESTPEISSATAEVRTLSVDFEATGSLMYEPSIAVVSPATGTVTAVVGPGTTLSSGDVIAVIDDVPVVWLAGEVPAWRTLVDGDVGTDVAQLETALDALGFNGDADVTIDDEYTAATASMVEAWQASIGAPTTGRVDFGTAVFGGERSRVAGVAVTLGSSVAADTELVSLGTAERVATFEVAPEDAVTLTAGDAVSVRLPDRSSVDATVGGIARAVDAWTVTTTFGRVELPVLDVVDVSMEWERVVVADELTIPSSALLRLDDGSYVVDVVADDAVERRPVEIGASVGTRVVVSAGLSAGDVVVVL